MIDIGYGAALRRSLTRVTLSDPSGSRLLVSCRTGDPLDDIPHRVPHWRAAMDVPSRKSVHPWWGSLSTSFQLDADFGKLQTPNSWIGEFWPTMASLFRMAVWAKQALNMPSPV